MGVILSPSAEFREIVSDDNTAKGERLVRAAVSAFCSLTRPTRREIAQLDDLAMPLYDRISQEAKRFISAALSECAQAPTALVRRLTNENIAVAAPLLMRHAGISDVDLIALIGRHGLPHARAIACRPKLDPALAQFIASLEKLSSRAGDGGKDEVTSAKSEAAATPPVEAETPRRSETGAAEATREHLRGMMRPAGGRADPERRPAKPDLRWGPDVQLFDKLCASALTGTSGLFQTALADALGIGFRQAQALTTGAERTPFLMALRALDLAPSEAFLLAAAIHPAPFQHPGAIARFLESYRTTHSEKARDVVRGWKAETLADQLSVNAAGAAPVPATPDNAAGNDDGRILKAS